MLREQGILLWNHNFTSLPISHWNACSTSNMCWQTFTYDGFMKWSMPRPFEIRVFMVMKIALIMVTLWWRPIDQGRWTELFGKGMVGYLPSKGVWLHVLYTEFSPISICPLPLQMVDQCPWSWCWDLDCEYETVWWWWWRWLLVAQQYLLLLICCISPTPHLTRNCFDCITTRMVKEFKSTDIESDFWQLSIDRYDARCTAFTLLEKKSYEYGKQSYCFSKQKIDLNILK